MHDERPARTPTRLAPVARRRVLQGLGAGLVGLAAAAPMRRAGARARDRDRMVPAPIAGIVPPRGTGGPLPLVDTQGRPFDFARLAGRHGLLTFGFTGCRTTCPASLALGRELLDTMSGADAPLAMFVTLDPRADSPQSLGAWLHRHDPRIVGLTGDPSNVERVLQSYRVGVRNGPSGLEHAAVWYLVDPAGDTIRVYPLTAGVERIAADIRSIRAAQA